MRRRVVWYICTDVLHEPATSVNRVISPDAAGSMDAMPCVYRRFRATYCLQAWTWRQRRYLSTRFVTASPLAQTSTCAVILFVFAASGECEGWRCALCTGPATRRRATLLPAQLHSSGCVGLTSAHTLPRQLRQKRVCILVL